MIPLLPILADIVNLRLLLESSPSIGHCSLLAEIAESLVLASVTKVH